MYLSGRGSWNLVVVAKIVGVATQNGRGPKFRARYLYYPGLSSHKLGNYEIYLWLQWHTGVPK